MNEIHYLANFYIRTPLGSYEDNYRLNTLQEVLDKMKENLESKSTEIIDVVEYRLVYDHKNPLPKADGYNAFFRENTYNKKYANENPVTAKVKDYKDNIQDYSENFKIRYVALDERNEFEYTDKPLKYFKEVNCVYNAESLQEAKAMLRSHTKSKSFFNIKMYQCRKLNVNELKLIANK